MESREALTPDAARAGLDGVATARRRLADQVVSPWWYRLGAALSTACLFVGFGLIVGRPADDSTAESASMVLIVLGACVAPAVLVSALGRATGVQTDRYSRGLGPWLVQMFTLLGLGFLLQVVLEIPHALAGAGVLAFVLTYDRERRIDLVLRERLQAGA